MVGENLIASSCSKIPYDKIIMFSPVLILWAAGPFITIYLEPASPSIIYVSSLSPVVMLRI